MSDLAQRLTDSNVMPPENISIMMLRSLLNSTGISMVQQHMPQVMSLNTKPIKDVIQAKHFQKVEQLFSPGQIAPGVNGDSLIDRSHFIQILSDDIKMSLIDINSLVKAFETSEGGKISMRKLEQEVMGTQPLIPSIPAMTAEKAKTIVESTFDQLKRFLAMNERNIVDVFQECEKDDGYFDRNELSDAFSRLSFKSVGAEHEDRIDAFFFVFDPQRTKKLDYISLLQNFYQRANSKVVNEQSNRLFKVYDQTRRFMKQKKFLSLASIFLDDYYLMSNKHLVANVQQGLELAYESTDFIHQLTKIIGIKELENYALQQSFVLAMRKSDSEYDKIDYHRFADFIGYEMPIKSNKDQIRKQFYRTLLKDIKNIQALEQSLRQQDINLTYSLQFNFFLYVIEGFSPQLAQDANAIKQIASDFALPNAQHLIDYQAFIERVRAEVAKQAAIQKAFRIFNDYLQFKDTVDLYGTLFAKVDSRGEKKFSRDEFRRVLQDKLGYPLDTTMHDVEQFFFEFDSQQNTGFLKYNDIERDYREFVEAEKRVGRLSKITNLPTILRMIKAYVDRSGQTLRQIFGKTKFGDNDNINQYQFTKIIHMIAEGGNNAGGYGAQGIDDASIHLLMNEISTSGQISSDNTKHVSFSELQSMYNINFNIQENEADSFVPLQVDKLIVYIAKVTLDNQRNNFDVKAHFSFPQSSLPTFVQDLKKEPLNCIKNHPQNILEELGKRYSARGQLVDTQTLIVDLESKIEKLKDKNTVFAELRKQINLKNQQIEIVFKQAVPEVSKFKIEQLSAKEFYNVFLFLECKGINEQSVREMLQSILQADDQGKYSYLDFIAEYKLSSDQDQTQARRGKRLYQSRDEVMRRIAYVIEHRGLKTFGSLLADQDHEGKLCIERDSFYRTIDSLQFALGEGDIQELIRGYAKGQQVDIARFKDELNVLIYNPEYKVELRSVLSGLIAERVVEHIEDASPRQKIQQNTDPKLLALFKNLAREITCGLYATETDASTWFLRFASFKKGSVTNKEFQLAIESLDASQILERPEQMIQSYYDNLLMRQNAILGYSEALLLIEQLTIQIQKDCSTQNRSRMIEDILQQIVIHLSDQKLPLADILHQFDPQGTHYMYRSDFHSQFLDNYLRLQLNLRTGDGLTMNQKLLLTTKYAPTESIISFPYEQFVNDLRRKEAESRGSIKLYMTQNDIDSEVLFEEENVQIGDQALPGQAAPLQNMPSNSKRNTFVTDKTLSKPQLRGRMQIASFLFDEIMMSTYRKGLSIEMYFRSFAKQSGGELAIIKEDFGRALASLGVEWSSNMNKVNEFFDSLDFASHGGQSKYITPSDLAEAVLLNGGNNVEDLLAIPIIAIHKSLKERNKLATFKELFDFYNTRRDNTCQVKEFKDLLLDKLELGKLGVIKEIQADLLVCRYHVQGPDNRVDFLKFIKDIEFCSQDISPALVWATELAANIFKSLYVQGLTTPEQLLQKYSKTQGIIMFEEFKRAIDELNISSIHPEEELRDFFSHVQTSQIGQSSQLPGVGATQAVTKVSLPQLISTIQRLCQKSTGLIYQDILQIFYSESKKNNMSATSIQTVFSQTDTSKCLAISYYDFKQCIEEKLRIRSLKELDLQVLAKRYKVTQKGPTEGLIQYSILFQDYEIFEKRGLKAGFDPLKEANTGAKSITLQQNVPKPMTAESRKIYSDMGNYCSQKKLIDQICDAFAEKEGTNRRGQLSYQQLLDVFKGAPFNIKLNSTQMKLLLDPIPADPLDSSYSYLIMIELLFTRQKSQEIQMKYKLSGQGTLNTPKPMFSKTVEISQRFKDSIEVKLQQLQSMVHSQTKGSYLMKEAEFTNLFRSAGIVVTSSDQDFLLQQFGVLKNVQTSSVDFRTFVTKNSISDKTSLIIKAIQQQIAANNVIISDDGSLFPSTSETVTLENFKTFIQTHKIDLKGYTPEQVSTCFMQMSDRRDKIEKNLLVRILKNEREATQTPQEWLPFIVNEFVNHIVNNNIDIFKFIQAQSKRLSIDQFKVLIEDKLKFKTSNPKDFATLNAFFAMPQDNPADATYISIDKIVSQVKKLNPNYGAAVKLVAPQAPLAGAKIESKPVQTPAQVVAKQLSTFSPKIKDILQKINEQVKRNGLSSRQLFEKVDSNKNQVIDKNEMLQYFSKDFQVKGIQIPADIELLFDALDMNKDNMLSINEFCLCLEGIQESLDQRIKNFDPDLQKILQNEIDILFDFFDTNHDGQISFKELQVAMKSMNPYITLSEIEGIMKLADLDGSKTIDRKEFMNVMLPKLKAEMISNDKNLEDLRRQFKESDTDHSNYLSKEELRQALIKLNIVLSDVQIQDLMREIDIDGNGVIDIDEFMAFMCIADQVKFKNPDTKATIIKIKQARKLQPMDFYNCFKNLPRFFQPSITQLHLEKSFTHTPSYGIYPEFENRTMTYKDLQKLEDVQKALPKKYIEMHQPQVACEIMLEEASGIPLPKKEDYDWGNITNREIRAVLIDFNTQEFLSNIFIVSATWKPDFPTKWQFTASDSHAVAKSLLVKTDVSKQLSGTEQVRNVQLLFELVLFATQHDTQQQVCCVWGSIPASQLDKQAKHKVILRGGSPFYEMKINKEDIHQEKKGFEFLKMLSTSTDEPQLTLSVKPFSKFTETQQLYISMLPGTCLINRRLLSFISAFRLYAFKKLTKAQQQMIAPQGNFAIAQFRKIFDNPDVNLILSDCWETYEASQTKPPTLDQLMTKMEDFLIKLYAIIYSEQFRFDHIYTTRSNPVDSEIFQLRENLIRVQLAPSKIRKPDPKKPAGKENVPDAKRNEDFKPFNIQEMEITMTGIDSMESRQDDLAKIYQQMGLMQ